MPVLEAVGWFGSAVLVVSLAQTRVMRFRVLNAASCAVLIGYNAAIAVWPMAAVNVVLLVINLVVITRLLRRRHDARVYEAVPIGVDEPFLARLLQRHQDDITAFNPDLPEDAPAVADHAFLVSTHDRVVGIVLSRQGTDPAEQEVLLDYVLPEFRDFTPGEFVFRPGGPFTELGVRRVVASPGMLASERYLRAVGFVEQEGRRVLELA